MYNGWEVYRKESQWYEDDSHNTYPDWYNDDESINIAKIGLLIQSRDYILQWMQVLAIFLSISFIILGLSRTGNHFGVIFLILSIIILVDIIIKYLDLRNTLPLDDMGEYGNLDTLYHVTIITGVILFFILYSSLKNLFEYGPHPDL